MSAGNHAQAVAYHAARLGIPATIVMPKGSPNTKIRNTEVHGARVVLEGDNLFESGKHARALAAQHDLVFVHPYEDELIIAGQGTVALEMLEAVPDLEVLVVPVGGGGLISGMVRSITTMSGRSASTCFTASRPSTLRPTTCMSGCCSTRILNVSANLRWSSAMRMRITMRRVYS